MDDLEKLFEAYAAAIDACDLHQAQHIVDHAKQWVRNRCKQSFDAGVRIGGGQ